MSLETFTEALHDINSREHAELLRRTRNLIDGSRSDMASYYNLWDRHDLVFRGKRFPSREDIKQFQKGQPPKLIVPLTYAQVMTFVAYGIMTVTQNRRFFELEPTHHEEDLLSEPLEMILERDLRKNYWTTFLVQFFLDIGKFSLGAAEVVYHEEFRYMKVPVSREVEGAFGVPTTEETTEYTRLLVFRGNRIHAVSPYRFFPDTRLPLARYQDGEFCGSEDLFSLASLKSQSEYLFNLDNIPKWTEFGYNQRRKKSRIDLGPDRLNINPNLGAGVKQDATHSIDNMVSEGTVVISKGVFSFIPDDFQLGENGPKPLGTAKYPIRYIVWYGNDRTIVRFEEATYYHSLFPYICAQYLPDQQQDINESLADMCEKITDLITWKLNTHIASQRQSVLSKFVYDPAAIDSKFLGDTQVPFVPLKKNAALTGTGVDRYIKQFVTQDVTANVLRDVAGLKDLNESVTGITAQMQGHYSSGRRSATQDRVVAQGASSRGKTVIGCIWDSAFEPLGRQLIANNRQEMDRETFFRIIGKRTWPVNDTTGIPYTDDEVFTMFKSDAEGIATFESFFVFDGTLPSEKSFLAQSLQEILIALLQNPEFMQVLGYGPQQVRELFDQIYLLRGVTPARMPQTTQASAPSVLPSPQTGGNGSAAPVATPGRV